MNPKYILLVLFISIVGRLFLFLKKRNRTSQPLVAPTVDKKYDEERIAILEEEKSAIKKMRINMAELELARLFPNEKSEHGHVQKFLSRKWEKIKIPKGGSFSDN